MTMPREIWVFRYHPTNEIPRHRGAWDDRVSYRAKSDVRFVRGDIHDKTVARADKAEALASDLQAKLTDCCLQALATDGQAIEALERAEKAEVLLAEAVEALETLDLHANKYHVTPTFSETVLRRAHGVAKEVARAIIAKIKEAKNG